MKLYKLTKHPELSGEGPYRADQRWNYRGNRAVYAASNVSLAVLEVLAHLNDSDVPIGFMMMEIEIEYSGDMGDLIEEFNYNAEKDTFPEYDITREFGTQFLKEKRKLMLKIPSVIVKTEYNYMINPIHTDIEYCKIKIIYPFYFDDRLYKIS